jgi:hypothetical protein
MAVQTVDELVAAIEAEIVTVYTATSAVFVDKEIFSRALASVNQRFKLNWRDGTYQPT